MTGRTNGALHQDAAHSTKAIYLTWALLMIATGLSWVLGTEEPGHAMTKGVGLLVLVIAFFKIDLVGRYFMELHSAPRALLHGFDAWCAGTLMLTGAIYYMR